MDFDAFLDRAWAEHGDQPDAVARRVETAGLAYARQAQDGAAIAALAHLAQHLHGGHLAQWQHGMAFQERLLALPACTAEHAARLRRYVAGLALAAGDPGAWAELAPDEQPGVAALAASNLADHDAVRAGSLLQQAEADADALALPDGHATVRALAVAGNNLAAALEGMPGRSQAQRALMLQAAALARRHWERAGTWLETERAEYCLSQSLRAAGEPAAAREHALECLRIVAEHGQVPLERFFGTEALALAQHAAGDVAACMAAVAAAAEAFAGLAESDRGWCQATLDQLQAL